MPISMRKGKEGKLSKEEIEAINVFNEAVSMVETKVSKMRFKEELFFYSTILSRIVQILVGLSLIYVIFTTWN